ncbi:hypothetical protein Dimus_012141 [Dionaea muscipula]
MESGRSSTKMVIRLISRLRFIDAILCCRFGRTGIQSPFLQSLSPLSLGTLSLDALSLDTCASDSVANAILTSRVANAILTLLVSIELVTEFGAHDLGTLKEFSTDHVEKIAKCIRVN